ncbi:MAG: septum formation initiator family protein [Candidatus Eisenbacteria bacterium]
MPNTSGVNRKKAPPRKKEPRFLRKAFPGYGRGTSAKVLRILAWTVGLLFAYAVLFGDTGLVSIVRMHGMRDELVAEMSSLEAERTATEERRDDLENDPWAIEKVAREEFGMIRDGETCYRVEPDAETESD